MSQYASTKSILAMVNMLGRNVEAQAPINGKPTHFREGLNVQGGPVHAGQACQTSRESIFQIDGARTTLSP